LAGAEKLTSADDCVQFADYCVSFPFRSVASVFYYREAFRLNPQLLNELDQRYRFRAAAVAILALQGKGSDAGNLSAEECYYLSQLARIWLRGELAMMADALRKNGDMERKSVEDRLASWRQDPELASVREDKSLAVFPDEERAEWQRFWSDVESLRKQIAEQD
jgi:hypothetical protein